MKTDLFEPEGDVLIEDGKRLARLPKHFMCAKVGRDLTWLAQQREVPPLVGREEEIERVFRRLSAPRAKNILIIGDSGVGKSALVESIASRLAAGRCPAALQGKRLIQTSFTEIWAEVGKQDDWAAYGKSLKSIIAECVEHGFILVMEEFQVVAGYQFSMSYLRPPLANGEITVIGTATEREFYNYLESDRATLSRFEIVRLLETPREQTIEVLEQRGSAFEVETGCALPSRDILDRVIRFADAYVVHQAQPGKSIALLEKAAENKAVRGSGTPIDEDDIRRAVSEMVGIDHNLLNASGDRLRAMEEVLNSRILGQTECIAKLCRRLLVSKSSLSVTPDRPAGVFLAVGPTGVGKSMLGSELSRFLTGSDGNLIRLDMNAYVTADAVYAIAGVPGEQSTERRQFMPSFTRQLKSRPYSIVLLDEIEKAHPKVLLLFLQAIDSGRFVDNLGNEASLRGCVVLMTSNAGHSAVHRTVGLMKAREEFETEALRAVKDAFPREFLGRVDEILVFRPLSRDIMRRFVATRVRTLEDLSGKKIDLTPAAEEMLCDLGFHTEYGARDLNRTIDDLLGYRLALLRHSDDWDITQRFRVDASREDGSLIVRPDAG